MSVVPGSSGRALPQCSVTIRSDDGAILGPCDIGEICIGPAADGLFVDVYTSMLVYWNRPDATAAAALYYEVLFTGDFGHLSADGDLFVTDRKNDLNIRGGSNVYPAEVERVLHEDERVAACAVLGMPDDRLDERAVAAVIVAAGAVVEPTEFAEQLIDRCRSSLSRYKVPDRVWSSPNFPAMPWAKW